VPVKLSDSILHRSIDDRLVLRFSVDNISADRLSAMQFLVLIVDESGSIRSGQGWRQEKSIEPLSSSQSEFILKYVVEKGNRVVLTAYEAIGSSRSYSVTPTKVLAELSSLKLVKGNNSFVKALGSKLGQTNPCAAAQSAAALACKCGIKSFSCNPQTGEYSFTCFSYQENPTACPDGPRDA